MNNDKFAVVAAVLGFVMVLGTFVLIAIAGSSSEVRPTYKRDSRTGLCFARDGHGFAQVSCEAVQRFLEK